jgi:hypothetical protein
MEHIILQNVDIRSKIHENQFGYKNKYSCKHAYFIVNETIKYYNVNKSCVYMASLDAQKAFDKLWRIGLFYKLKKSIPSIFGGHCSITIASQVSSLNLRTNSVTHSKSLME